MTRSEAGKLGQIAARQSQIQNTKINIEKWYRDPKSYCSTEGCNNQIPYERRFRARKFCSQSCAAKTVNKNRPPRKVKPRYCSRCQTQLPRNTRKNLCICCNPGAGIKIGLRTKGEAHRKEICHHAVYVVRGRPRLCEKCGYNKIVHICHIKSVSSFPKNTLVSEINAAANLRLLCPNCHWEVDHPEKT